MELAKHDFVISERYNRGGHNGHSNAAVFHKLFKVTVQIYFLLRDVVKICRNIFLVEEIDRRNQVQLVQLQLHYLADICHF